MAGHVTNRAQYRGTASKRDVVPSAKLRLCRKSKGSSQACNWIFAICKHATVCNSVQLSSCMLRLAPCGGVGTHSTIKAQTKFRTQKKGLDLAKPLISLIRGGKPGIRTLGTLLTFAGFQDRCIQPLCQFPVFSMTCNASVQLGRSLDKNSRTCYSRQFSRLLP